MQRLRHLSSHNSFLFLWIAGAVLVFAGLGYSYIASHPAGVFDGQHEGDVRTTVAGFGNALATVSLLAPDAATQIRTAYAPYVAPDLLAQWEADPSRAPGRATSSPWPDHITVDTVTERAAGVYDVSGHLVFATSAEAPEPAPVALTVTRIEGAYLITQFSMAAAPIPSSLESVAVSLGEPQTALGVQITVTELIADDRCAAVCVSAGAVRVRALIGHPMGTPAEAVLVQGVSTTFDAYVVTLAEVLPEPSMEAIAADQYVFIFRVETR